MQDLLRDPVWQFWGAVFGFLAVLVTVIVAAVTIWYQRRSKNLSCEVLTRAQLVGISDKAGSMSSRLRILYDDKPIENAQLLVLRMRNSGNTPIIPHDFIEPVSIVFSESTQILDAEVSDTDPANLQVTTRIDGQKVVFDPTLLNKNDSITIKFLLAGSDASFKPNGRIVGVKDVRIKSETSLSERQWRSLAVFVIWSQLLLVLIFVGMRFMGLTATLEQRMLVLVSLIAAGVAAFYIKKLRARTADRTTHQP